MFSHPWLTLLFFWRAGKPAPTDKQLQERRAMWLFMLALGAIYVIVHIIWLQTQGLPS